MKRKLLRLAVLGLTLVTAGATGGLLLLRLQPVSEAACKRVRPRMTRAEVEVRGRQPRRQQAEA
jgi:hypothetical protein